MHDALGNRRACRTFNVLNDYDRKDLGIRVDVGPQSARITRVLDQIVEWRGRPAVIRLDNGGELCNADLALARQARYSFAVLPARQADA